MSTYIALKWFLASVNSHYVVCVYVCMVVSTQCIKKMLRQKKSYFVSHCTLVKKVYTFLTHQY